MLPEVDRSWLAGFIDGEGYVGLHRAQSKNVAKCYYSAHIGFRHTHLPTMNHVVELLKEGDIVHYAIGVEGRASLNPNHKDSYYFNVASMQDVLALGEAVRPYTVTKTLQWDVVMEWCRSRLALTGHLKPYSERDMELVAIGTTMNRRGTK